MHPLHCVMTCLAFDIAVDMPLVIKKHMLCHQINLYPGYGRLCIEISVFLFYPRMICDDIVMTMQTLFHRWKSRKIGISNIGVTILARYLFHPGVYLMTERYGLFGADIYLSVSIEKKHKYSDKKNCTANPE